MSTSRSRGRPRVRTAPQDAPSPDSTGGKTPEIAAEAPIIRVAAAQYPLEFLRTWSVFEEKITRWVGEAARAGAEILVFPEYGALELASLFPNEVYSRLDAQLEALQSLVTEYRELFARLAMLHRVFILAPSYPVRETLISLRDQNFWDPRALGSFGEEEPTSTPRPTDLEESRHQAAQPSGKSASTQTGRYVNRAWFFGPDGSFESQDKHHMTRFEAEEWGISPGDELTVFSTPLAEVGVNICYDVEFPIMARAQTGAGALLLLVPSCTETLAGYHRVRIGAQARALENQCYVVHAVTIGDVPWSPALERGVGAAAVYVPPDGDFPDDGVLVQGKLNQPGWIYADLNLNRIHMVRKNGTVLNFRDWHSEDD